MSSQNTLLTCADDAEIVRPKGTIVSRQVYRNKAAQGSGIYKAMDENGNIEIIGGPGVTTPSQLFAHAFFVDSVYGNDTGGGANTMMDNTNNPTNHKFATIGAALATAAAGDVIYVYPGIYFETNFYKDDVRYFLLPGVQLVGTIDNTTSGSGNEFYVYGYGQLIRSTSNLNAGMVQLNGPGKMFIECESIDGIGCNAIYAAGAGTLNVIANNVSSSDSRSAIRTNSPTGDCKINLQVRELLSGKVVDTNGGNNSPNVKIIANKISNTYGTAHPFGGSIADIHRGDVTIICDDIFDNSIFAGFGKDYTGSIAYSSSGAQGANATIIGNMICQNVTAIWSNGDDATAGVFKWTGNITATQSAVLFLFEDTPIISTYRFNGVFKGTTSPAGGAGIFELFVASATMKLFIDGEIHATTTDISGISKEGGAGPQIIIGDAKIITPSGGGAPHALNSSTALDTYVCITTCARTSANNNMTVVAAMGNDYQNAAVQ